jgi:hypothetical protein
VQRFAAENATNASNLERDRIPESAGRARQCRQSAVKRRMLLVVTMAYGIAYRGTTASVQAPHSHRKC